MFSSVELGTNRACKSRLCGSLFIVNQLRDFIMNLGLFSPYLSFFPHIGCSDPIIEISIKSDDALISPGCNWHPLE